MDVSRTPKALLQRVQETTKDFIIAWVIVTVILSFLPTWWRSITFYFITSIFFANIVVIFVTNWKPRSKIQPSGKAVVISGCDSGFGYLLAQKLDALGFQVFAGCLFPDGQGAQNLKKSTSNRLHIVQMDVTKDENVQDALAYVQDKLQHNKLWAVVCNAGINDGGEILWTDMETTKKVIDVNTFGVIRVTKAFLPEIRKNKGRVVVVSSAAARYTCMGMVPYCTSKHATAAFCDGLRLEMYRWGVQVITIEPWMYRTNIMQSDNVTSYIQKSWHQAPQDIKGLYPSDYMEHYTNMALKYLTKYTSDKLDEVVFCLTEAITAKYPQYSYSPGTVFLKLPFWFIYRLPKPFSDYAITNSLF